jgi:hypothetical protein
LGGGISAAGKQYLAIAAGGRRKITEEKLGDSLVAYALPQGRWRLPLLFFSRDACALR